MGTGHRFLSRLELLGRSLQVSLVNRGTVLANIGIHPGVALWVMGCGDAWIYETLPNSLPGWRCHSYQIHRVLGAPRARPYSECGFASAHWTGVGGVQRL